MNFMITPQIMRGLELLTQKSCLFFASLNIAWLSLIILFTGRHFHSFIVFLALEILTSDKHQNFVFRIVGEILYP